MNRRIVSIAVVLLIVFPVIMSAQTPEFSWSSPRSVALGGVGSTGFDEPSAMHLNPASLVDIERFSLNAGFGAGLVGNTVEGDLGSVDCNSDLTLMPSVSGAINFGSRLVAAGFSINTFDFGEISYPSNSFNKYQGNRYLHYSGGFDAALAFMPIRDWAFGVKIGYMAGHAEWERKMNPFPDNPVEDLELSWNLDLDTTADWNALLGVIWSPNYRFEAGITYRPTLAYHYDPEIAVSLPESMGGVTIRSEAKELRVEIPQEIRLGFHWLASERLDLYLDAGWTQCSGIDDLEITTSDPKTNLIEKKYTYQLDFDDVWHGHLGLEYLISSSITLRAGTFYYSDSGNDTFNISLIPTSEHYGFTGGAGLHFFEWDIDFAVGQTLYSDNSITGENTSSPLTVDVQNDKLFGSVSVKYRF